MNAINQIRNNLVESGLFDKACDALTKRMRKTLIEYSDEIEGNGFDDHFVIATIELYRLKIK
jgi:hypothetical protein